MGRTGYFVHPDCRLHDMGAGHPECPARIDAIEDRLLITGVADALERREPAPATMGELLLAHGRRHVAALRGLSDMLAEEVAAGGPDAFSLDPDTSINTHTWRAALLSAGAAIDAVDAVLRGELENAFCATRPPGHHATRDQAMGFCFFSNVAIAAKYACERHGLKRVAIVDFDVHHGNGTQAIFEHEPRVLFASSHQSPLYPGTGSEDESGVGNIVNGTLSPGAGSHEFRELWDNVLLPRLDAFKPQLVLVSAGFDAHRNDPLADIRLGDADYAWITERLLAVAERHAGGRLVSTLEGGYDLAALTSSTTAHVQALVE